MPADTGMAFLVISHQHAGHTSLLPELLGKCTQMPSVEATEGVRLEPNHVYVSPPGGHVALSDRKVRLMEGAPGEMPPHPIDFFFRSLAQDQKERAICIVLSGTGTDGTLGLKAIKGESGMAMVQEVQSARYAGMPSSAIATALADYVLPPAAMPAQLVAYARGIAVCRRTTETVETAASLTPQMQTLFALLRERTGHDFSSYKQTTMHRRIERRMTVHQVKGPNEYVRLLQENPHEIDILFKELLIGVTSFFRDPEAFRALAAKAIAPLMASRPDNYTFRAWVPGCGSGEEAYTVAILLRECARELGKSFDFQVFGTDIDPEAIEHARTGRYPAGIAADVPTELLQRYFIHEDDNYRLRKEIREMLVFAPQNVIKDPPFTKVDLLCCRNLLIYLNADLQKRLLPIFHYSLKPDGVLMLGPSETIGGFGDLFKAADKKWKIFTRLETPPGHPMPTLPAEPVGTRPSVMMQEPSAVPAMASSISSQLETFLLGRFTPPAVVTNNRGDIIYIHGRTGLYLEPGTGQPRLNIHDMAREGLGTALASAMRQAVAQDQRNRAGTRAGQDQRRLRIHQSSVLKIAEPETIRGLLLVTFRPAPPPVEVKAAPGKKARKSGGDAAAARVKELEREVQYTRESLQTTVEELETSNEELKSANEELQSTNEELQSTNEEMETSKEEMQSLNEELTTVNAELQSKLDELSHANDDMQNLLNSTDIATIFLDNDLNIKRYTEQATKLVKLIPTDIGRPLADLVSVLRTDRLAEDAAEVLRTLVRKELEVETEDGAWFLVRMLPYRTSENVIEGLVITFVDITANESRGSGKTDEFLQNIFDTFQEPALVLDGELRVVKANESFCRIFHTNPKKTEGQLVYKIGGGKWDAPKLRELLENDHTQEDDDSRIST